MQLDPKGLEAAKGVMLSGSGILIMGEAFNATMEAAILAYLSTAPSPSPAGDAESPLEWAVRKWHHEVANRPLENVHRAALDTTWRQVIRHFGGDDEVLCGPDHYTLVEQNPATLASLSQPAKGEREGGGL